MGNGGTFAFFVAVKALCDGAFGSCSTSIRYTFNTACSICFEKQIFAPYGPSRNEHLDAVRCNDIPAGMTSRQRTCIQTVVSRKQYMNCIRVFI